jgi:hypothetical protein
MDGSTAFLWVSVRDEVGQGIGGEYEVIISATRGEPPSDGGKMC